MQYFCFRYDLRRGCVVFAWLQMILVIIITSKLQWMQSFLQVMHSLDFFVGLHLGVIIAIEGIKCVTCLPLIWGLVKQNHTFYQPWLFINGLENASLVLLTLLSFIGGCFNSLIFYFLIPLVIFSVFGWYTWFCVYTVYKKDMKPSLICFVPNQNNILLNNE